ncbi:MAG: hypothetical protein CSA72_02815 [Rhodobacterales bacterium]|nr:MAG: hypothetical protein CSA72_02815 [Rhodobacterales bacterium]
MSDSNKKLRTCPACSNQVSKKVKTCPHCGERLKRGFFYKLMVAVLGLFVAFVVLLMALPAPDKDPRLTEVNAEPPQSEVDADTWRQCKENDAYFEQLCKGKQVVWVGVIKEMKNARDIKVNVAGLGNFRVRMAERIDVTATPVDTEISFVAEVVNADGVFIRGELRDARILEVLRTASEFEDERRAEQAEAAAREAEEEAARAEAEATSCIGDLTYCESVEDFVKHNNAMAAWRYRCVERVEQASRYGDVKWGSSFMNRIQFESYEPGEWDPDAPSVTLIDRDAEVPNAFGTMERTVLRCTFDPKALAITELTAQ